MDELYRIKLRRDTSENWNTENPILESGEPCIDTTLNRLKIGNGEHWNDTDWFAYSIEEIIEMIPDVQEALADYYTKDEVDSIINQLNIPTKTSDLINDSNFATQDYVDQHTPENVVLYTPQVLTEEQKAQVRSNIGAGQSGFSGDYNDLTNKPFIPSKTSDLTNDSGFISQETEPAFNASAAKNITSQDITSWDNKSDFSGNYSDLAGKPTIPTKTSDLTNDSDFATTSYVDQHIPENAVLYTQQSLTDEQKAQARSNIGAGESGFSGDYNDLTNKPFIPSKTSDLTNDSGFITDYTETDPVFTASPAHGITSQDITNWNGKSDFSGSYNDLTNKPTIPTKTSDLTNDSGYITTETEPAFNASPAHGITSSDITNWNAKSDFSGSYNDLTDKPTIPAAQVNSDWNANSGVAQILNKPTVGATDGDTTLAFGQRSSIATVNGVDIHVTMPNAQSFSQEQADWNQTDNTQVDFIKNKPTIPVVPTNVSAFTNDAGYLTTETEPAFNASAAKDITSSDITNWNNKSDFSGSYNDLTDKPTIPTVPTINGSRTIDVATSGDTKTISRKVLSQTITSAATTLAVASNTIYTFTNDVTSLNLSSLPTDDYFESLLIFHTGVNNIQITLPASAVVYGSTILKGSKDYIIAVKNNQVAIAAQGETTTVTDGDTTLAFGTRTAIASVNGVDIHVTMPNAQSYSQEQADWNQTDNTQVDYIKNKPTIPTVPTNVSAFTNDAGYLTSESDPVFTASPAHGITTTDINTWNAKSDFSGSYNDLTDKPTIPTKTSDLTNDSGFITGYTETDPVFVASPAHGITAQDITDWNAKSDFSGSYNDLTNKPTIPTKTSDLTNDSGYITGADWDDITNKPVFATVATSGSYSDLSNKPSIPTKTSDLTNDSGYITGYTETDPVFTASPAYGITSSDITGWNNKSDFSGSYTDLTNKPTIPSKTSDLTNDSGFITGYTETDPVFTASPAHGITSTDISNWNAKSDFSGSYNDLTNKPTIPSKTSDLTNDSGYITGVAWNDVTGKPTFATVATSGDYTDLINTPTIPAAPVQTDWSEYDSSSLAYLANRPSWVRNTQQWTLQDDQQVSKGIPMVITNNYQWGLGVNEIIAPAYGRTATTDLLTVKTTDANGEVITDTIMHVGTNGVYAPEFYENGTALANKYAAQSDIKDSTITITQGGVTKGSFTLNQSTAATIALDAGGGASGMTVLSYGNSTWSDFTTAYSNNAIVYCRASSNSDPSSGNQNRMAFMAYVSTSNGTPRSVEFQYYRSVDSKSSSQQCDQVFIYTLNNSGVWSVTTRETMAKVVAGTGLTSSYSNGELTLNAPANIVTGDTQSYTIWTGTQAEYDAITTKSNTTVYLIKAS